MDLIDFRQCKEEIKAIEEEKRKVREKRNELAAQIREEQVKYCFYCIFLISNVWLMRF